MFTVAIAVAVAVANSNYAIIKRTETNRTEPNLAKLVHKFSFSLEKPLKTTTTTTTFSFTINHTVATTIVMITH